jgi:hypothetical protein
LRIEIEEGPPTVVLILNSAGNKQVVGRETQLSLSSTFPFSSLISLLTLSGCLCLISACATSMAVPVRLLPCLLPFLLADLSSHQTTLLFAVNLHRLDLHSPSTLFLNLQRSHGREAAEQEAGAARPGRTQGDEADGGRSGEGQGEREGSGGGRWEGERCEGEGEGEKTTG